MIEPDPELGTAPSVAVPVLLDLDESGAYVRGRNKRRRVEVPAAANILEAARRLYLEEHQVHGAPSRAVRACAGQT
eukprot:6476555-Amphidinium_carterae.2